MAEPNVGLMADTVSKPAGANRLLTLHCEHPASRKRFQTAAAIAARHLEDAHSPKRSLEIMPCWLASDTCGRAPVRSTELALPTRYSHPLTLDSIGAHNDL